MKSPTLQEKIILCVDDDPLYIRLLKEVIESGGGTVLQAGSSDEAFRILAEERPDLLLLDIKLPGMNGYEMTTKIKGSKRLSSIPVVALTVLSGPHEKEMAFLAGCDGYIPKPVNIDTFIPTILEYISGRKDEPVMGEKAIYFKEYCHRLVSHVEEQLKEIEASRLEWETTFNAITDMIVLCDTSGTLLKVNSAALDFLDIPLKEAAGKKCRQLWDTEEFNHGKLPFKEALSTGKPVSVEIQGRGSGVTLRVTIYPLPTLDRFVVIARDISESVLAFERQQDLLEDLGRANQVLMDFAHVVSHDIKAPLRAITAFSEMLAKEHGNRLSREGREWLGFIRSGSRKLQTMINDMLLYAKAGNKNPNAPSAVDVHGLVRSIIRSLQPPAHIRVDIVNTLPEIEGCETELRQIFQNLLSNAIKSLGEKGGSISVGCKKEGEEFAMYVKDDGPGIEKKLQERVFQLFDTAGRSDKESTGLGLALVRKTVEMNGGRVWLKSEPGEGATFYFTCPRNYTRR